jgi:transcriptional regulator with XRE-family HTH domain
VGPVSKYDEIFLQILRSNRLSFREIEKLTGFSLSTISRHTEDRRFPKGTDLNVSIVLRQLIMKAALDAWEDAGINGREYALTIEKYIGALKGIEDLREVITLRDEMLAMEKIMTEEQLPEELLEILQARYDRLNEELNG